MSDAADGLLHLTISGYPVEVGKSGDGSVTITVHVGIFGPQSFTIPAAEWANIVAFTGPGSLQVAISGYAADVVKSADGSVAVTLHLGIFGDQALTITADQWAQILAYTGA